MPAKVLLVEDNRALREALANTLAILTLALIHAGNNRDTGVKSHAC
jgi:hypothetical protein